MEISETKIRKRKDTNTYYFDVTINGKRFRRSGFKTKKEALASSIELIDDETKKTPTTNSKVFFKDYYMDWVKAYNKLDLSVGQRNWYKRSYKIFLDYFGEHIKMSDVTRKEYQKFLNDYGVGRNSETIRKVNNCISPVFNEAKYEGLIERDPTYRVKYNGTVSEKKASDKYLNIDDYLKLIELFREKESASYIALLIMSLTGARNKEVLNLTLEDIDLENNEIFINGTKTKSSKRYVEVGHDDLKLIYKNMCRLPKRVDGKVLGVSQTALNKTFKKALKKCGIKEDRTAYSLRHTHCSYLLSKGLPIEYISNRLGHANISITLEIYSHLLKEEKSRHGDTVRNLFS